MNARSMLIAALSVLPSAAMPGRAFAGDVFIGVAEAKALAQQPGVRFICADSEKECTKAHLPGSVFAHARELHFLDDVRACKGLPMCEPAAARVFGELGIDAATKVVVYDAGAGVNASGVWFLLELYGQTGARILDGGLATWKAQGGAVESGPAAKVEPKRFMPKIRWEMIAGLDETKKATSDATHYLIVDARHTLDEYAGKTLLGSLKRPGSEFTVPRGGFIPGAVFSPWTKYAGNRSAEPDKPTLKSSAELEKQLEKLEKHGYAPNKTVISYCHIGLGRGSFQYLAFKRAGHDNVKLYVGSWAEWGSTESLPVGAGPGE